MESIGQIAFSECDSLTEITIPPKIETIPSGCFRSSKNIKKVKLIHVKNIEFNAFAYCPLLDRIDFGDSLVNIDDFAFSHSSLSEELIFPASLVSLNSSCFYQSQIKSIIFNSNITLNKEVFYLCTTLESVLFNGYKTTICASAFYSCKNLKSVKLPKDMKIIENYTFDSCENLIDLRLPDNLEEIHLMSFYSCKKLKIIFPETLKIIGKMAFSECSSITELYFPRSLQRIEKSSFSGCYGVKLVQITSNLVIDDDSFITFKNLTEIRYNSSDISEIYVSYYLYQITLNIVNVSDKITIYPITSGMEYTKINFMNISCEIKEINSGNYEFLRLNEFTYLGSNEISGNMSNPDNIHCVNINEEYEGNLFGKKISKYKQCGKDNSSKGKTTIILISCISVVVVVLIVIVSFFVLYNKKNRQNGFSNIEAENKV